MSDRVERHLCVIFAADVAGYSSLMRRDEEGTLAQLVKARRTMDALVGTHRGRVVNSVGDSVLAEFSSVVDAMQAAIEIQRNLDAAAADIAADRRVLFRIGLQLGEVMVRSTDIYGDGVNVAARLQTLAAPGGIVVSGSVYDQLRDRLAIPFVDLGEQTVKNIDRPVPAFGLTPDVISALPRSTAPATEPPPARDRRIPLALAVIALSFVAAAGWWTFVPTSAAGAPPKSAPASALVAMSLAIAPLNALTDDAAASRFAETLRRDLATGLSALERRLTMISLADERDPPAPGAVRASALRAGARYVIEGDVRSQGDAQQVSLQVVDVQSGVPAWSVQLGFRAADAEAEAAIARRRLLIQLASAVSRAETKRVLALPLERLTPTELVIRGLAVSEQSTLANTLEARRLFEAALRLDPNHPRALQALCNNDDAEIDIDPHPDRDRLVAEMDALSIRALQLEGTDPAAWESRRIALADLGRWGPAIEAADQAIKLDPYLPVHYSMKAWLMNMTARPAEALKLVDAALALKPANPGWEVRVQCESFLLLGRAADAVRSCEKASGLDPADWIVHLFLVAAYANHGDMAMAADARRAVLKAVPEYSVAVLRAKRYSEVPEYLQLAETYWYEGLRKAGIPEK